MLADFGGDPQRSLARPDITPRLPASSRSGRGAWAATWSTRRATATASVRQHVQGRTYALDAKHGEIIWRRQRRGRQAVDAGDRRTTPDRRSKDGTVTALDRSNGRTLWQLRTDAKVESSPVASTTSCTSARPTAGSSPSTRRRATCAGRTTPAAASTRARPSTATAICISTYAGSIFCLDRRDGHKLWSTYVKRDPFRYESFYASPSTDGSASSRLPVGQGRRARRLTARCSGRTSVGSLGYTTPAIADGPHLRRRLRRSAACVQRATGTELWERARRRPDSRPAGRRRQSRLLLHSRAEHVRRPRRRRADRVADRRWASTRPASPPTGATTSR